MLKVGTKSVCGSNLFGLDPKLYSIKERHQMIDELEAAHQEVREYLKGEIEGLPEER